MTASRLSHFANDRGLMAHKRGRANDRPVTAAIAATPMSMPSDRAFTAGGFGSGQSSFIALATSRRARAPPEQVATVPHPNSSRTESVFMAIVYPSAGDPSDVANQARRLADALESLAAHGRPSAAELADAPLLDRWSHAVRMTPVFVGVVAGHPLLGSDRFVRTSEIFAIDSDQRWARTWSRFYRLGAAHSNRRLQ